MLNVLLAKAGGRLRCEAEGHALFDQKGRDIVCAASSILLRTAARTLKKWPGIRLEGDAPQRGVFKFEATADSDSAKAGMRFAADFLREGFESLAKDFPQNILFECNLEE